MLRPFAALSGLQKALLGIIGAFGVIFILGSVVYLFPSASNQGYMPEQPIPFSHKLHAGKLKMDCRYCHTSAYKGRHAGVPSLHTCMNCHKVVKQDSPYIQKLKSHYEKGEPIEWIRIHSLPDFSFFNHRPHLAAGVSCQTCHGEVQNMEKVYQDQPLTMGWCKNCHEGQTTPISVLKKIHPDIQDPQQLRDHAVAPLNCSTCHY